MGYNMFSNFDALWDYVWKMMSCVGDSRLLNVVELLGDTLSSMSRCDKAYIYAICQAFLLRVDFSEEMSYHDNHSRPAYRLMEALLMSKNSMLAMEVCNNIMHILHLSDNTIRELGTKWFCANFFDEGEDIVYLWYQGCHLNGKSRIPEQFVRQIKDAVAPYGYCEIAMRWVYSHLDMGSSYDYSRNEPIAVTISCDNEQGLEMAIKAVKSLKLVYKED